MGYYMSQRESQFRVLRSNFPQLLSAVQGLYGKETIHDGLNQSNHHFSWVDQGFQNLETVEEILEAWRWSPTVEKDGDIIAIEFCGEKLGDDKILFDAIAPYVVKGSYITMEGDDSTQWKWVFDGKTCIEVGSTTVWDDDESRDEEALFNKWLDGMPELTVRQGAPEWEIVKGCYDGDVTKYLRDSFRQFLEQQL